MKEIHVSKWLNNLNIKKKLMLSYILVVLLPVLLIGLVLTFNMREMVTDRAEYEASNSVDRVYTRFNDLIKLAQDLFGQFTMDANLDVLVRKSYQSVDEVVDAYSGYSRIKNSLDSHSTEIEDIKLYTFNQTMLNSGQFITIDASRPELPWIKRAKSLNGVIYWQVVNNPLNEKSYLSLTALLKGPYRSEPLGILLISINQSYLTSIIKEEPYDTIILDDTGTVLAAKRTGLAGKKLEQEEYAAFSGMTSGIHDISYENEKEKAIVKTFYPGLCNKEFRIISLVPVSTITDKVNNIFKLGFFMMMLSLMLAAVLFSLFSNIISKRLKRVSVDMHTVALGNFDFLPSIDGNDEIGQLSRDLGVMVKSIKDLVHEVYEVNLQKNQLAVRQREIKLKMLASQINPHFLFNALEAIRMKAYCNGDNEVADVIMLLGKILRRNLEVENELVPLSEEIDIVKSYLVIQKFRYGNRFNYKIDYDSELLDYRMLPLILQPIVENSVIHAFKYVEDGGEIRLLAEKCSGLVKIAVEDNGCGIDDEKLQFINNSLNEVEDSIGQHIGLKNVYQRIKLFYGDDYGMNVLSIPGKGTRVEITLPEGG